MDIFAVIADPTRRAMLEMMAENECAAGALVAAFPTVSQPAISQHLKVLRESGLVTFRSEKQRRFYTLRPASLSVIADWVSIFERGGPPATAAAIRRPVPKPKPVPALEPAMLDLFG